MRFPKSFAILSAVVLVALLMTSCGPAVLPTAKPEEEGFILALPRITVSYAADGAASLVGLKLEQIAPVIQSYTGQDVNAYVGMLKLDPFWVSWMTNADIQHVEIVHSAGGVLIFVNGKILPHLAWSGESLGNVVTTAESIVGQSPITAMAKAFIPFIRNTGIGVVLTFPKADGAAEIAVRAPNALPDEAAAKIEPSMILKADVDYDSNGIPTVHGFDQSLADMATAAGLPALNMVTLPPMLIGQVQALNIQSVELRSRDDGIWIYVNGMEMPHIAWSDAILTETAGIYAQMNPNSPLIEVLNFLLPSLAATDVNLIVHFPVAGA
jgi:hypothetical protein